MFPAPVPSRRRCSSSRPFADCFRFSRRFFAVPGEREHSEPDSKRYPRNRTSRRSDSLGRWAAWPVQGKDDNPRPIWRAAQPPWYYNLRAQPAASVTAESTTYQVCARELVGPPPRHQTTRPVVLNRQSLAATPERQLTGNATSQDLEDV